MASTYTSRIRLEKQADGENNNSWGTILNQNVIDLIDEAIAAYTTVTLSSVDVTLTTGNGSSDQARSAFIEIVGTITSSVDVIIPAQSKGYFINNVATVSSGCSVTFKTAAGTGQNINAGERVFIVCDGVSVHSLSLINDERYAQISAANTYNGAQTFNSTVSVSGAATFKQVESPIVTLTDATSISVDFSAGNHFLVSLAGNRTLENPTNGKVGQVGHIYLVQDGTGNRTLSFGDMYNFPSGTAPTLSTNASARDLLVFSQSDTSVLDCIVAKNFSVPA